MTLDQIQALTDEEIRVRVAELCGWTYAGSDSTTRFYCPPGTTDLAKRHGFIPNYPADLNACHEFEAALSGQQWPKYVTKLCELTRDRNGEGLVFATARQRCEAFLAVMTP